MSVPVALAALPALATLSTAVMSTAAAGQAADSGSDVVRIVARKLANGKVEFALRKLLDDGTWGGTLLPRARMFPTTATVGSWLSSTPISVLTTEPSVSDSAATRGTTPAPFTALEAGMFHTCGVRNDDTLTCWGDNAYGQNAVRGGRFIAVSASGLHSCGIRTDGSLTCWGDALTVGPPRGVDYV